MQQLAHFCRQQSEDAIIITGGGFPSAAYSEVLEHCPSIDAVCMGEGEIPLTDLINASSRSALLESHTSWITRQGLVDNQQPQHDFVQDLDEIPMLDYSLINLDDYNSRSIDKRNADVVKREMAIHTSRGCPFKCVFCSNPSIHGRDVRAMSVERCIEEVKIMKERHGMTVLLIEDDHFFFDKDRAKKLLVGFSSLDIRIEFPNGVAVYAIDEEIAELFKQAGVTTVALAVESGSDYVLNKIIKKPLRTKLIPKVVQALKDYGIQAHVFIVIGLPGEMDEHRQETLDMLLQNDFDWAHVFCAAPILGSRLYDICVTNDYLEQTDLSSYVTSNPVIKAPGVDPDAIKNTAYQMNLIVNFVNNANMRNGNYQTALKYFKNVIDKYPTHAFGQFYYGKALKACGDVDAATQSHKLFQSIIEQDDWWYKQSVKHGLIHKQLNSVEQQDSIFEAQL